MKGDEIIPIFPTAAALFFLYCSCFFSVGISMGFVTMAIRSNRFIEPRYLRHGMLRNVRNFLDKRIPWSISHHWDCNVSGSYLNVSREPWI